MPAPDRSWKDAIARYEADIATGRITFDSEGYAASYPGKATTERQVAEYIAAHVVDYGPDIPRPVDNAGIHGDPIADDGLIGNGGF